MIHFGPNVRTWLVHEGLPSTLARKLLESLEAKLQADTVFLQHLDSLQLEPDPRAVQATVVALQQFCRSEFPGHIRRLKPVWSDFEDWLELRLRASGAFQRSDSSKILASSHYDTEALFDRSLVFGASLSQALRWGNIFWELGWSSTRCLEAGAAAAAHLDLLHWWHAGDAIAGYSFYDEPHHLRDATRYLERLHLLITAAIPRVAKLEQGEILEVKCAIFERLDSANEMKPPKSTVSVAADTGHQAKPPNWVRDLRRFLLIESRLVQGHYGALERRLSGMGWSNERIVRFTRAANNLGFELDALFPIHTHVD